MKPQSPFARPTEPSINFKLETNVAPALTATPSFQALEKHTGIIDRWRADRAASREAGHHLADLRTAYIQAEAGIALTSLKIGEAQIKTALVSTAMMQIGALTTELNAKTAGVEQRLTTGSHGELIAHLQNRAASVAAIKALERDGRVLPDEAEALISFAQADAVEDINRSRERTRRAKNAVEALHSFALDGIARAKNNVGY